MRELLKKREIRERTSSHSGWFYDAGKSIYSGQTEFQDIELVETPEFGTTLLLDGATQVMEKNEFQYHEPMTHLAMLAHPDPERILVIGGGDGGILREVLKHPSVKHIDYVEIDKQVVEFSRVHLKGLNAGAFDDARVTMHFMDGRAFVEQAAQDHDVYDIVIMDMTDPAGPSLMLYTSEFFKAVRQVLKNEQAFFVMHSESPETRPQAFIRIHHTLASAFESVRPAYTYIRMYGGLWSFAISSKGSDPAAVSVQSIQERLKHRNIHELKLIAPQSWHAFFAEYPYIQALLGEKSSISTDADPEFPDTFDPRV